YTIPEEMSKGSLVGNIALDLGLEPKRLIAGKARIYTRDSGEFIELNRERGVLLVKQRIDREALCEEDDAVCFTFSDHFRKSHGILLSHRPDYRH
ncbi:unnamed protein product, partial [Tetraodon nigroviridis]